MHEAAGIHHLGTTHVLAVVRLLSFGFVMRLWLSLKTSNGAIGGVEACVSLPRPHLYGACSPGGVPAGEDDMCAPLVQPLGCRVADARVGARNDASL